MNSVEYYELIGRYIDAIYGRCEDGLISIEDADKHVGKLAEWAEMHRINKEAEE